MSIVAIVNGKLVFTGSLDSITSTLCSNRNLAGATSLSNSIASVANNWASANDSFPSDVSCCCSAMHFTYNPHIPTHPPFPDPWDGTIIPIDTSGGGINYVPPDTSSESGPFPNPQPGTGGGGGGGGTGGGGGSSNLTAQIVTTVPYTDSVFVPITPVCTNVDHIATVSTPSHGTNAPFNSTGFTHTAPASGVTNATGSYTVVFNDGTIGSNTYQINYVTTIVSCGDPYEVTGENTGNPYIITISELTTNAGVIDDIIQQTSTYGYWVIINNGAAIKYTPIDSEDSAQDTATVLIVFNDTNFDDCNKEIHINITAASGGGPSGTNWCCNHASTYPITGTNNGTPIIVNLTDYCNSDVHSAHGITSSTPSSIGVWSIDGIPANLRVKFTPANGNTNAITTSAQVHVAQDADGLSYCEMPLTLTLAQGSGGGTVTNCSGVPNPVTDSRLHTSNVINYNLGALISSMVEVTALEDLSNSLGTWHIKQPLSTKTVTFTPTNGAVWGTSDAQATISKTDGSNCLVNLHQILTENPPGQLSYCSVTYAITGTNSTGAAVNTNITTLYNAGNLIIGFHSKTEVHGTWSISSDQKTLTYTPSTTDQACNDSCRLIIDPIATGSNDCWQPVTINLLAGSTTIPTCSYSGPTTLDLYSWDPYPNTSFVFDMSVISGFSAIVNNDLDQPFHGQVTVDQTNQPALVRYYPDQPVSSATTDTWTVDILLTDGSHCSVNLTANLYNTSGTNTQY